MRAILAILAVSLSVATAVAMDPPKFDAAPGCRAGAESGVKAKADIDGCLRSEHAARDDIVRQWDQFVAADRARCAGKTHMGGPPSYIEVLTCLEMARDARKLPKGDNLNIGLSPRR